MILYGLMDLLDMVPNQTLTVGSLITAGTIVLLRRFNMRLNML